MFFKFQDSFSTRLSCAFCFAPRENYFVCMWLILPNPDYVLGGPISVEAGGPRSQGLGGLPGSMLVGELITEKASAPEHRGSPRAWEREGEPWGRGLCPAQGVCRCRSSQRWRPGRWRGHPPGGTPQGAQLVPDTDPAPPRLQGGPCY